MQAGTQQPPLLAPLTQEDLGHLQIHLPALKIMSFRGPGHSGGVVTSLSPLTKQLGTKVHWIALSGVPSSDDSSNTGFSFHRPDTPAQFVNTNGRAIQEYLWPLLHGQLDKANFDPDSWRDFRELSQVLATQSVRVSSRSFPSLIWLHDFEMVLVAPLLPKEAGTVISHFWHAPWPEASVMAASPVGAEITEALLSNRVLGFHTGEYALNFLNSVQALIPTAKVSVDNMTIAFRGNVTRVVAMPLGIDFPYWQRLARTARVESESIPVRHRLAQQVILGIDRLDYTKGLLEKLSGIEAFLEKHPDWARRFHCVQLAQPVEVKTPTLDDYRTEVLTRIQAINAKYRTDGWEPIVYLEGQFTHPELAAWYQAADVLAVTPVRDGLNLIAKEYVACRLDEQGVLVLSNRAGVSAELQSGAVLIEPTDPREIADALSRALTMGVEEKRRRMVSMRHVVGWNRLHDWACGFLRTAIDTTAPAPKS